MKKTLIIALLTLMCAHLSSAQGKQIYDEKIDPLVQIDDAVKTAAKEGKFVICQVGGNWCRWCLMFADFITNDSEISSLVKDNYVYIHVNYPRRNASKKLVRKLGNAGRFGFPALVVMDGSGKIIHIQDSSYLESGNAYDREKVVRFLRLWSPSAL